MARLASSSPATSSILTFGFSIMMMSFSCARSPAVYSSNPLSPSPLPEEDDALFFPFPFPFVLFFLSLSLSCFSTSARPRNSSTLLRTVASMLGLVSSSRVNQVSRVSRSSRSSQSIKSVESVWEEDVGDGWDERESIYIHTFDASEEVGNAVGVMPESLCRVSACVGSNALLEKSSSSRVEVHKRHVGEWSG